MSYLSIRIKSNDRNKYKLMETVLFLFMQDFLILLEKVSPKISASFIGRSSLLAYSSDNKQDFEGCSSLWKEKRQE